MFKELNIEIFLDFYKKKEKESIYKKKLNFIKISKKQIKLKHHLFNVE